MASPTNSGVPGGAPPPLGPDLAAQALMEQAEWDFVMAQRTIEYCKKLCSELAEFWSKNSHAP